MRNQTGPDRAKDRPRIGDVVPLSIAVTAIAVTLFFIVGILVFEWPKQAFFIAMTAVSAFWTGLIPVATSGRLDHPSVIAGLFVGLASGALFWCGIQIVDALLPASHP